jgi:hypothetical protein
MDIIKATKAYEAWLEGKIPLIDACGRVLAYRQCSRAAEECGSVSLAGNVPNRGSAGGLDAEGLRLAVKIVLKAESRCPLPSSVSPPSIPGSAP